MYKFTPTPSTPQTTLGALTIIHVRIYYTCIVYVQLYMYFTPFHPKTFNSRSAAETIKLNVTNILINIKGVTGVETAVLFTNGFHGSPWHGDQGLKR